MANKIRNKAKSHSLGAGSPVTNVGRATPRRIRAPTSQFLPNAPLALAIQSSLTLPVLDSSLDGTLNPCSSAAEPKRINHFAHDLVVGSQLAVRGNPAQELSQF